MASKINSIACVDGLKGFPEAIETIYPKTQVQLCPVHLMRFSLAYVSFKERKAVAADLKVIYRAATAAEAENKLVEFAEKWDARYPSISKSWRARLGASHPDVRLPAGDPPGIYTTNAIESLHMSLRKVIKTRASFPNDDAAFKLLYLAPAQYCEKVDDADPTLESGDAGFCHHFCRPRLAGRLTEAQRWVLTELLDQYEGVEEAVRRVERKIGEEAKHAPNPFVPEAVKLLDTIPGIAERVAETIVSEIGVGMNQFPTDGHLASWAGMCPGNNESAGKRKSGKTRKGNRYVCAVLVQAAWAASHQ